MNVVRSSKAMNAVRSSKAMNVVRSSKAMKVLLTKHIYLFYVVLAVFPINLGKHYIFTWSYVSGILVDYFVPTLYLVDIVIALLLIVWLLNLLINKTQLKYISINDRYMQAFILFIFSVFLSVIIAARLNPSVYAFSRLLLYAGLFLYIIENFNFKRDFKVLIAVLSISTFIICLISLGQFIKQSSVFNNYLIFGEQPYKSYTPLIVHEDYFGVSKIPPYGIFSHPNILGAFLSVFLPWFIYFAVTFKINKYV